MTYKIPLFASVADRESSREVPTATIDINTLPPDASFLRILGVNYVHLKTSDDGDLYLTEFGIPYIRHLHPDNWYEDQWFKSKRERLQGTSTVYRVPTRPVADHLVKSIDLVVKWSRVGQDVPLDTFTLNKTINAEFNTPFEEFSLVEELRQGQYGPQNLRILTQKPLAIYVPPERMQLWQTGRSKDKIVSRIARHPGIEIDVLRSYILLYGWIHGLNAIEAYRLSYIDAAQQEAEVWKLTDQVNADLEKKGFMVADNKPSHIIVRPHNGNLKRRRDGSVLYSLIDYELLARTPQHEESVKRSQRSRYLQLQKERFNPSKPSVFPQHLKPANIMNVDYIHGRTESTGGVLWVVGKDPELFNYFLPERWRTKQVLLSPHNQTFYTQTKDRIHLVWKVSRVGELPLGDFTDDDSYEKLLLQGLNSPFEEFSIALELMRKGVLTSYPRAIYQTGHENIITNCIIDETRFERFKNIVAPDGRRALRIDRDYITIWGYWRGLEDDHAPHETGYWTPISAQQALVKNLITSSMLDEIVARQKTVLADAGFVDSTLSGNHVLLSYIPEGAIKHAPDGFPEVRQCNFEMIRRL